MTEESEKEIECGHCHARVSGSGNHCQGCSQIVCLNCWNSREGRCNHCVRPPVAKPLWLMEADGDLNSAGFPRYF